MALVMGVCGMVFLLLPLLAPHRDPVTWTTAGAVAGILGLFGLLGAISDSRTRIVADEAGLRWRSVGHWRSASWSEVEDFYLLSLTGSSASRAVCVVRTQRGTLRVAPAAWTRVEELRRVIQSNVGNGPEEGWRLLGGRRRDGDAAIFPYGARTSRLTAAFFAICGIVLPALWLPMTAKLQADLRVTGPEAMTLTALSLLVGLLLLGMILPVVWLCFLMAWRWWRCRGQVIEVTPAGLAWTDGNQRPFIPWSEVVEYGHQRERRFGVERYVRGASGEIIRFMPFLRRSHELQAMIQRLAVRVEHPGWKPLPEEALGGPRLRWRGGTRVYHYRSRLTRVLLWFAGTPALMMWMAHITTAVGLRPYDAGSLAFADVVALICDAVFVCLLLCYYRCAVLVDEDSISTALPFGRKRLLWLVVNRYGTRGNKEDGTRFVAGEHATLWISPLIVDLDELQREIATRAPQAEGSWPISDESLPVTTS